ncbi:MAG: acyltransferase, partial [Cytophagales bacterium]|nr:acyltransferase [Cytophagales bacterium]
MALQNQHRAVALDGLRGFAAWAVVGYHYLLYFYSGFAPAFYNNSSKESGIASILIQSPLNFLFNGPLAVSIFFVISGFVLSYGYFSKPDILHLQSGAFRRYFRLVIPIAAAQLFSFTLLINHLYFNQETAIYTHTPGFLGSVYLFTPNFWFMVKETFYYSLIGGFTYPWQESYNNVLWTLQIEFMGSLLVFCILALTGTHKLRGIVYVILIITLINSNLIGFVLGLALADIMNSGGINTLKKYDALNYFLFILGILIGCNRGQTDGCYHYFFGIFLEIESAQRTFAQNTVSATLLVISLVHSNALSKLFSSRWFNFMGRI